MKNFLCGLCSKEHPRTIKIFGYFFILLGIVNLFGMFKAVNKIPDIFALSGSSNIILKYFVNPQYIIGFFISLFIINYIITGIGILKYKGWGWHLTIFTILLQVPIHINIYFTSGWIFCNLKNLLVVFAYYSVTLYFFTRPNIKQQFLLKNEKIRMKSPYGAWIFLLFFLTLCPFLFSLGYKTWSYSHHKGLFFEKPLQFIDLPIMNKSRLGFVRREVYGLSFAIPNDFYFGSFSEDSSILSLEDKMAWFISSKSIILLSKLKNPKISDYAFQEFFYSNNWGIIYLVLRDISNSNIKSLKIEKFRTPKTKGFINSAYSKDGKYYIKTCSVYDLNENNIGEINFILDAKDKTVFPEGYVLEIISSIKPADEKAIEEYYQKGVQYFDVGKYTDAQFEFAKACYLSPYNADYRFMIANSLYKIKGRKAYQIRYILERVLEYNPEHLESKKLLKIINLEIKEDQSAQNSKIESK